LAQNGLFVKTARADWRINATCGRFALCQRYLGFGGPECSSDL